MTHWDPNVPVVYTRTYEAVGATIRSELRAVTDHHYNRYVLSIVGAEGQRCPNYLTPDQLLQASRYLITQIPTPKDPNAYADKGITLTDTHNPEHADSYARQLHITPSVSLSYIRIDTRLTDRYYRTDDNTAYTYIPRNALPHLIRHMTETYRHLERN